MSVSRECAYQVGSFTILATGIRSCGGVHPKAQAHVVQLIGHVLHTIGKFGHVWLERPISCPAGGPAIIEHNVIVAKVPQAVVDNLLGCSQ